MNTRWIVMIAGVNIAAVDKGEMLLWLAAKIKIYRI